MDGPEKVEQICENKQKYTLDIKQSKQLALLKMKKRDIMGKSAKRRTRACSSETDLR